MTRFDPIAIVGIGGIFPGATDLDDFWSSIRDGRSSSRDAPDDRWILPPKIAYSESIGEPDRVNSRRGCLLEEVPPIDACLRERLVDAGVDPAGLDPLIAIVLEIGRRAFENGRFERFAPDRVGAVFGNIVLPTETASALSRQWFDQILEDAEPELQLAEEPPVDPRNRYAAGLPGGLLATALGFTGGTSTIDAACASSLYALHLAARELHAGRLDAVLAGGVSRPDCLYTQMGFSQLRAVSPTGTCRPFDERGDGLVVGEGGALFALRRLEEAVRDGDEIWGVIRGIGLSNDLGGSLLAPDTEGQLRALREAYDRAGWDPSDVDVIECHATGTPLGDAIEADSLKQLWNGRREERQCVIGSVKSNVGHLLTAAGAAGVTKILLSFRHETLPPTANFERSGAKLDLENTPFRVLSRCEPFPRRAPDTPRRGAISAFGFGGINAHVLIEEWSGELAAKPEIAPVPKDSERSNEEPIAIVGIGACLPRVDRSELPEVLLGRGPRPTRRPDEGWGAESTPVASPVGLGGIDGHRFESLEIPLGRYRIPPKEFPDVLPQQWAALEAAADAFDEAKWAEEDGRRTGAFIGIALDASTTDFTVRWGLEARAIPWAKARGFHADDPEVRAWIERLKSRVGPALSADRTLGALGGIVASRIARELRLGGPSFTVSSEETSGLRALEHAVHALRAGDLDRAIVGAVEIGSDLRSVLGRQAMKGPSAAAEPIGEGAFAVAVMRHSDAVEAGRPIYACIRAIASASGSCDAPSIAAARAGSNEVDVSPSSLHDRIGECGAAAGLGDVTRAALSLATHLAWDDECWVRNRADGARTVEVHQSSVDGSASHVVLEADPGSDRPRLEWAHANARPALFAIEADSTAGLDATLAELASSISTSDDVHRLAHDWLARRPLDPERSRAVALVVDRPDELVDAIDAARRHVAGEKLTRCEARRVFYRGDPLGRAGELAFVYPGSGNHYRGMGRELSAGWVSVVDAQDMENARLRDQWQCDRFWSEFGDSAPENTAPENTAPLPDAVAAIFGQVSIGSLVTDVLRHSGVEPLAVIGHSLGETASLFAHRVWRDRDGMLNRMLESPLFTRDLGGECRAARHAWGLGDEDPAIAWRVGVVDRDAATVRAELAPGTRAYVLIANTPNETVIGGAADAVDALVAQLGACFVELRDVSTVHCEVVESVREQYLDLHRWPTTPPSGIRFYSAASAAPYDITPESAAESITAQAISGFDFPALIERAYADGVRIFLEVGPGASASRAIATILGDRSHRAFSVLREGENEARSMVRGLARLIAERIPVAVERVLPHLPPSNDCPSSERTTLSVTRHHHHQPLAAEGLLLQERATSTALTASSATATFSSIHMALGNLKTSEHATSRAHATYLQFAAEGAEQLERVALEGTRVTLAPGEHASAVSDSRPAPPRDGLPETFGSSGRQDVIFDTADCMKLAIGRLTDVLGEEFAEVDRLPTRVRLPDDPLMLVHRVVELEGTPRSLGSGRVVTEHDIVPDAWYLDSGRIPTCIAVEAGQADLFLSGYLGIDLHTQGNAVYRLLDAEITFHGELPAAGETIRYDIRIDHFFFQGDTALFRFSFEATVGGSVVLTMQNGCAGFFTRRELDAGQGIVQTKLDLAPRPRSRSNGWRELAPFSGRSVESYDDAHLDALRRGDIVGCFGEAFLQLGLRDPETLPSGRMHLVDRVLELDPEGGRFGLGRIRAELDIHPEEWFLTCHFSDDRVMPGTLMYECCLHTLRIFLMRMGWIGERGSITHQPVAGVRSRLKCRGQVITSTRKVQYDVSIKELGYGPEPYAIADVLMYADGRAVVEMTDMSVRITGLSKAELEQRWSRGSASREGNAVAQGSSQRQPAIYDNDRILAFAVGKPSVAFGSRYEVFDSQRVIARLPGPPYKFLDRITGIHDGKPFVLAQGARIQAQYDVPPHEWYFQLDGSRARMPFAILLEVALQPCGWLAAYLGSALVSDVDLKFRNLGGSAVQLRPVTPNSGTLTTEVKLTALSHSGGMIIQHYDLHVRDRAGTVYEGTTYFGFFTAEALASQIGIRDAQLYEPSAAELERATAEPFPTDDPYPRDRLRMIDHVSHYDRAGGTHGLGFVRGSQLVDPDAWFFAAHFHQDPVCPGSLGLEAFLQLLQLRAMDAFDVDPRHGVMESMARGVKHEWIYRGQYIPSDREVTVEANITAIDADSKTITAEGFLSVDGRTIYRMVDFSAQWVEAPASGGGIE